MTTYPVSAADFDSIDRTVEDLTTLVAAVDSIRNPEFAPSARHIAVIAAEYERLVDAADDARDNYRAWSEPIESRPGTHLTDEEIGENIVHGLLIERADRRFVRKAVELYDAALSYLRDYLQPEATDREHYRQEFPQGDQVRLRRAVERYVTAIDALDDQDGEATDAVA